MIRAVLFDMDGVLVDTERQICQAAICMFAEIGLAVQPEDFLPFVGAGENRYLGGVAEKYGVRLDIEQAKHRTYTIYGEIVHGRLEPLPGVCEFIGKCRAAGIKTAVATSADLMKMEINLREMGIPAETFDATVNGLQVVHKKPFPEIYLTAARKLNVPPQYCLVVEDAVNGVQAAKAAGMYCLALTTSFDAEQLKQADVICKDLSEVPDDILNASLPDLLSDRGEGDASPTGIADCARGGCTRKRAGGEAANSIIIKGARVNNLKNIDVSIPRDQLVVITGLSGSGKSSLAYDTVYAEGQRRYVESLSSYARQFLGRIHKPEVDFIHGIPPAIAIEQKVNTRNPRSTVGTSTEIYDYIKLLFARIGITYSPVSGEIVKKDTVTDAVNYILSLPADTGVLILFPLGEHQKENFAAYREMLISQGFARIEINGEINRLEEASAKFKPKDEINIVVDRIRAAHDEESSARYADSIQTAFNESDGRCIIRVIGDKPAAKEFSNRFERDGILFDEPNEHMFSFNSPYGACPRCEGYGKVIGIDEDLVVPDKSLSIYQDAVACWRGESMSAWKDKLIYAADKIEFPIHKPYNELTEKQRDLLWHGTRGFGGIDGFFKHLDENKYKIQYRVMTARYSGKTACPECRGGRLRKESSYVKVNGKVINELVLLPVDELYDWFTKIELNEYDRKVAQRILTEIINRLEYLNRVGLRYLTLNRLSSTLSGGEAQRINLATSLGSSLVGSLYILDEPSIGLHPRDTKQLIGVLKNLKALGNTVVVVEHDEEMMRAADRIIDIGPLAGRLGGEIVFEGTCDDLVKSGKSLTAAYLTGKEEIAIPSHRRKGNNYLEISGARANNLKNITVRFPLNVLCVVTGVSGSGKSTLVRDILFTALERQINGIGGERAGTFDKLTGDINKLTSVEFVDQNPIGRSTRSNPVTYSKAYDDIRKLFSEQQQAKYNDLKPAHFSFNIEGGRCEECQGDGEITVEMQFMADVKLVCEACNGKKFKEDVLEVTYRGKNIYDVLELTVDEAGEFFGENRKSPLEKRIVEKLKPLSDVGLGYVKLGQSSATLSGGESQRIKLASFISGETAGKSTLFIFDEPTTGLHFHDIRKLLDAFNMLIENGSSVLVIEHNPEIIKCADWVIDLGPEGGKCGGNIVFQGTPEELVKCGESYTGQYLKEKIK